MRWLHCVPAPRYALFLWYWRRMTHIGAVMTGRILATSCSPCSVGAGLRAESVLNGLMAAELEPDNWVLVHDAARPCLTPSQLQRLIAEVRDDDVGGILAIPVADTLKRATVGERIELTENRSVSRLSTS